MEKKKRKTTWVTRTWRLALALVAVVAVVQELRKPAGEREWHGKVADFVPYDFRKPTAERFRTTFWNPEGSLVSGKVFGAGWALNFGALARMAGIGGSKKTPDGQTP